VSERSRSHKAQESSSEEVEVTVTEEQYEAQNMQKRTVNDYLMLDESHCDG
jgi:hypothetical protein